MLEKNVNLQILDLTNASDDEIITFLENTNSEYIIESRAIYFRHFKNISEMVTRGKDRILLKSSTGKLFLNITSKGTYKNFFGE